MNLIYLFIENFEFFFIDGFMNNEFKSVFLSGTDNLLLTMEIIMIILQLTYMEFELRPFS